MTPIKTALTCGITAVALLAAGIAGGHLWAEPDPVEACNALSHSVGNDGLQSEAGVCLGELFQQRKLSAARGSILRAFDGAQVSLVTVTLIGS